MDSQAWMGPITDGTGAIGLFRHDPFYASEVLYWSGTDPLFFFVFLHPSGVSFSKKEDFRWVPAGSGMFFCPEW